MGILAECPFCHTKQGTRNKRCANCSGDLDRAKRSQKVRYWISYYLHGKKQRREPVGFSIEGARASEADLTSAMGLYTDWLADQMGGNSEIGFLLILNNTVSVQLERFV